MLNFDTTHRSVDGDLKKKKGKKILNTAVLGSLIISNLFVFSACAKTVPCDIEEDHAHYYVNEKNDLGRYIVSEKSEVSGLDRTDDYVAVNEDEEELLKFINKNELYRIEDNTDAINAITSNHQDFTEYEYSYPYTEVIPIYHSMGTISTVTYQYIPMTGYDWTTDKSLNLTGKTRQCHYVYFGYRVKINEKNKYELVKSDPVDDLSELPSGYDYIKSYFYDIVNTKNLDYGDEEKENSKSSSKTK